MPPEITIDCDGPAVAIVAAVDAAACRALCERVLAEEEGTADVALAVLFAGDDLLRDLNRRHRGLDEPTDVLSFEGDAAAGEEAWAEFPGADADRPPLYLGDIAISVEAARRQAESTGIALDLELRHLLLHGLLHLLGHDHESPSDDAAMRAREEALLGPAIHAGRGHEDHD